MELARRRGKWCPVGARPGRWCCLDGAGWSRAGGVIWAAWGGAAAGGWAASGGGFGRQDGRVVAGEAGAGAARGGRFGRREGGCRGARRAAWCAVCGTSGGWTAGRGGEFPAPSGARRGRFARPVRGGRALCAVPGGRVSRCPGRAAECAPRPGGRPGGVGGRPVSWCRRAVGRGGLAPVSAAKRWVHGRVGGVSPVPAARSRGISAGAGGG